jgi:AraC-like DNA-binding protein/mannose-6-phosphate isomerase-like protein (cupin superfamily)
MPLERRQRHGSQRLPAPLRLSVRLPKRSRGSEGKPGKFAGLTVCNQTVGLKINEDADRLPDCLTEVLRTLRLRSSIFFRSELSSPWGMSLDMTHQPRFHIVVEGSAWISLAGGGEPVRLDMGDIAMIPNGAEHWIADDPESERVRSELATDALRAGKPLFEGDEPQCRLICGLFHFDIDEPHPLMALLPDLLIWPADRGASASWVRESILALDDELRSNRPGSQAVADRLCEVLLIHLLRRYENLEALPGGFYRGLNVPSIARALNAIHAAPERDWSLASLANEAGLSRSVLAERFHELVGVTPMGYITTWRMRNARELLLHGSLGIKEVAERTGYSSAASFSRAYKRFFGDTPRAPAKSRDTSLPLASVGEKGSS